MSSLFFGDLVEECRAEVLDEGAVVDTVKKVLGFGRQQGQVEKPETPGQRIAAAHGWAMREYTGQRERLNKDDPAYETTAKMRRNAVRYKRIHAQKMKKIQAIRGGSS